MKGLVVCLSFKTKRKGYLQYIFLLSFKLNLQQNYS